MKVDCGWMKIIILRAIFNVWFENNKTQNIFFYIYLIIKLHGNGWIRLLITSNIFQLDIDL